MALEGYLLTQDSQGARALQQSDSQGTWESRHFSTWALKTLRQQDTWALEALEALYLADSVNTVKELKQANQNRILYFQLLCYTAISYFRKEAPSQMFNGVLSTSLDIDGKFSCKSSVAALSLKISCCAILFSLQSVLSLMRSK